MKQIDYLRLVLAIRAKQLTRPRVIVAIDGRCGSGKTTLAARLQKNLGCTVFHMDDFFPRPEQRTDERLSRPGENVDHERFLAEVLLPLMGARPITYRPYLCASQQLGGIVKTVPGRLVIVEGAYACHPSLWPYYDLRIFLSVPAGEQRRRILKRNGAEKAAQFNSRWIPLEERYFKAYDIPLRCDLRING